MGRFFTNFGEAWQFFVDRDEELEDFFARMPEDGVFTLGWVIRLDGQLVPAAQNVQRSFSHLDWVTVPPGPFLHTWIGTAAISPRRPTPPEIAEVVERGKRAWADVEPFEIVYRRINCFHDGIVAEAVGGGTRALVDKLVEGGHWDALPIAGASRVPEAETYLPHLTLGYFNRPHDAAPLRALLTPLRDEELGRQLVREATLCVVWLSREPVLGPLAAVGSVAFA